MSGGVFGQHAWLWMLAWQSTLCLAAGLGGSLILRHRPARAHQALLIGLIAAALIPALSWIVRHHGWGLLLERPALTPASPMAPRDAEAVFESPAAIEPEFASTASSHEPDPDLTHQPREPHARPWLLSTWILTSGILLLRLMIRFVTSVHLVRHSSPVQGGPIAAVVETARSRLGIDRAALIRSSEHVRSPVIWCWTARPVLLIPSDASGNGDRLDWTSIVCHELAHWKRRDHLCGLFAELMVCALPWQALLWWAHRRLVRLSEEACDDWVVACGRSGVDYAETLLDLTPQGRIAFVPAVVSSRKPLAERIHRLLQDNCGNPRPGLRWSVAAILLAACVTLGVAFAQTRPARQPSGESPQAAASRTKLNEVLDAMLQRDTAFMPIAMHVDIELYGYEAAEWQHGETYSFEQRFDGRRLDSVFTRYRIENGKPKHTQNARRVFTGEQYLYRQEEIAPAGNRLSASLYPPEEARDVMAYYFLWGGVLFGYLDGDSKPVAEILKDSPATVLHDEMEDVDGAACHVIEGSTNHGTYQLWVDPQHDYRIRKAIVHKGPGDMYYRKPIPKDAPIDKWNTARVRNEISDVKLEKIGGHFIPVAETQISTLVTTDGTEYRSKEVVKRSAIDVSPDFSKLGAFVMDGIPDGTRFATFDPNNTNYGYEWHNGKAVPIAPDGPTILGRVQFTGYDNPQMALTERREFRAAFRPIAATGEAGDGKQTIPVRLGKDGSFRIENIPPGKYSLQLALTQWWPQETGSGGRIIRTAAVAKADREISIADIRSQGQEKTIDLGVIEMAIEGDRAVAEQTRSLRFPQDRSLGTLYMRDAGREDWYEGWENAGEAQGNRFVAGGKQVKLEANAETAADLSPLAGLGPDDLQMLGFDWKPVTVGSLAPLAMLTGLRAINLQSAKFDPDDFRYLTGLQFLEVLRLGDYKLTDSSMEFVGNLTALKSLALWGTGISDEGLKHLQGLTRLTFLALNNCAITDKGLLYLHGMTALEGLQLRQTKISDDGLVHLRHLTRLKNLSIGYDKITDAGLKHLEGLAQLETLSITMDPITDEGLASLAMLKSLKAFDAYNTKVTDAGLVHLEGLQHLEHVTMSGIGDAGIGHLSKVQSLNHVQILDATVTKASVPYFQAMPSLAKLLLSGDLVGDDLLEALRAALPQCQVWDPQRSREYPMPEWRQKFEAVYRLEEGEILKRIAPPFIPERMDYYKTDHEHQAELIPDGPDSMTFHWDRKLQNWGMAFGHRVGTLNHVLNAVLQLKSYEYEGPKELLDIDLPGDWIVRDTATEEQKLRALEQLMAKELGWKIRFNRREVERPVIVATGRFEFQPLPNERYAKDVQFYIDTLDVTGGGTARSVAELLQRIGDRANMRIIDKTEPSGDMQIRYNLHRSSRPLREMEDGPEKERLLKGFLDNIAKQTQLHFEVRTQPVEVWQITAENYN
jgi:beta-lactamase regulating signal transducer with metallopeptidase domain